MKTLLIVESPAKSKTIEKLLGPDYIVKASFGHIRELDDESKKEGVKYGIEVENGFRPVFKIQSRSSAHIQELKRTMEKVDRVLLASDEDREGEAIAWHCAVVLKLQTSGGMNRICFHEITKNALEHAVSNPRNIDMNMVYSQQTRQILDKLVGYELSPLLWKSIAPKLSAGRVQSVCLKIIVDREREIQKFTDKRYFKTLGYFKTNIVGLLNKMFESEEDVQGFLEKMKKVVYTVENIEVKRIEKRPPPPFTTSSIQQDIGGRFGMPSKKIMSILQNLYENGKITYHRTDCTNLSEHIMKEIKDHIVSNRDLGKEYFHPRIYKTKSKSAQEAHEAIRPTSIFTLFLDDSFDQDAKNVYQTIWKRTVASQMAPYSYDLYTMTIGMGEEIEEKFLAKAEKVIFEGYKKIYDDTIKKGDAQDEEDVVGSLFGDVKIGDTLVNEKIVSTEKYQNPPVRYSEATIIKKMEVVGIGRPSTYASILDKLFERKYVEKKNVPGSKKKGLSFTFEKKEIKSHKIDISIGGEKNKLVPTEIGIRTVDYLVEHFQNIMNEKFTSEMEDKLDEIAGGTNIWNTVVGEYYQSFHPKVEELTSVGGGAGGVGTVFEKTVKRLLGKDGEKNVYVYQGKFGPIYQIGEDKEKTKKYLKLLEGDEVETATFEDYQKTKESGDYPKKVGEYEGKEILLKKGKYGFYLVYKDNNYKIKPTMTPEELTEEEAIECLGIQKEVSASGEEVSITFPIKKGKYMIRTGQYGPYVQLDKIFASIPKTMNILSMTEEDCKTVVENKKKWEKEKKTTSKVKK